MAPRGGKPRQARHGGARPLAHHVVERAADEQEEQQGRRRVEVGMRRVVERVVEAEGEGERHADGDRHVHVGAAVPQRRPGRGIEDPAGIEEGREGEQRRDEVEGLPGAGVGPRPDRHRQDHDVHRAEARHRERPDEARQFRILRILLQREQVGLVADAAQGADQVGRALRRRCATRPRRASWTG